MDGSIRQPASLYDVLRTIVDVLEVAAPWSMISTSLLEEVPTTTVSEYSRDSTRPRATPAS